MKQPQKQPGKPKKAAAANKFAPTRPAELDPSKLLLETGAFCVGHDEPVSQVSFATLGPLASGIALATYPDALPFLQAGKLLTRPL